MHDTTPPPAPRQPYERPDVAPLGAVRAVTAGPVQDPDKNLDQLFGGTGGFARQASPVS
jgi:hypothetical protein